MEYSGNSGSMQSSSTGNDEEFDSSSRARARARAGGDQPNIISSSSSNFLNPSPHHFSSHPLYLTPQNPTFFDPQSSFPQSSSSIANLNDNNNNNDLIWSRSLRSDHQQPTNSVASTQQHEGPSSHPDQLMMISKNPKKRTRASRRAPTTVLTTDTTNFRQMVQEFTGIPASPFSANSPYSRRLDLFSSNTGHLVDTTTLYPLRPSPNKFIFSPFSSSSSSPSSSLLLNNSTMIDSIVPTTTTVGASTSDNYQLRVPSEHLLINLQHQNIIPAPPPLQLGAGNNNNNNNNNNTLGRMNFGGNNINIVGGFPSQETTSSATAQQAVVRNMNINDDDDNNVTRSWTSGGGGGEEAVTNIIHDEFGDI
ncbi:hypothetical protein BUALT_Bualt15G0127600 [Buddleja alternifolia]|uniref:VQ domain-containing protein n=1 Tax=Buddleja alternifolia TaxID=168488 RepID=A0AAV6WMG3_9LAMI|nr:hypothetical protein BUALT_Bualt15G0127600 [Buddleja alternifolia]